MRYASVLFVWAIAACGAGHGERRATLDAQPGQDLVGAWDVRLSLTRPYPLEHSDPPAKRICGIIGFVENHYAKGAALLAGQQPHVGVYDLDLPALGLDWLDDTVFPSAVVSEVAANPRPATIAFDTIAIVLNPGSPERIVLLGSYDVRGIDGKWTAQSSRGTATGSFSLRRHGKAGDRSGAC
jgi:hypothetical protein